MAISRGVKLRQVRLDGEARVRHSNEGQEEGKLCAIARSFAVKEEVMGREWKIRRQKHVNDVSTVMLKWDVHQAWPVDPTWLGLPAPRFSRGSPLTAEEAPANTVPCPYELTTLYRICNNIIYWRGWANKTVDIVFPYVSSITQCGFSGHPTTQSAIRHFPTLWLLWVPRLPFWAFCRILIDQRPAFIACRHRAETPLWH